MARIEGRSTVDVEVPLVLSEGEAAALAALTAYGADTFLKVFYQHLGRSYLEPHEAGLRSLFAAAGSTIPPILERVADARRVFEGRARVVPARDA